MEAQALPEGNLLRGLARARGQSAAPPHLAHNSTVPNPALQHLPSHQPCQRFCSPWAEQLLLKCCCASPYQGFSQLRELSISLFGDLTKTVVGNNRRQMRDKVRMGLLPLFFRMSDQTQSVAKVQISKLSSDAGKRPPHAWARASPSFLRAGSPQEQSQEEGDARSPSPGRGAISQLLLFCRPPGKPSLLQQTSSSGKSSDTSCRHSRPGGLQSAW